MEFIKTHVLSHSSVADNGVAYLNKNKFNSLKSNQDECYVSVNNKIYNLKPNLMNDFDGILTYGPDGIVQEVTAFVFTKSIASAEEVTLDITNNINKIIYTYDAACEVWKHFSKMQRPVWKGCTFFVNGFTFTVTDMKSTNKFVKIDDTTELKFTSSVCKLVTETTKLTRPILYVNLSCKGQNLEITQTELVNEIVKNIKTFNRGTVFEFKHGESTVVVEIKDFNSYITSDAVYEVDKPIVGENFGSYVTSITILSITSNVFIRHNEIIKDKYNLFTVIESEKGIYSLLELGTKLTEALKQNKNRYMFIGDKTKLYIDNKIVTVQLKKVTSTVAELTEPIIETQNTTIIKQAYEINNKLAFGSLVDGVFVVENKIPNEFETIEFEISKNKGRDDDLLSTLFGGGKSGPIEVNEDMLKLKLMTIHRFIDMRKISKCQFENGSTKITYKRHKLTKYETSEDEKKANVCIGEIALGTKINFVIKDNDITIKKSKEEEEDFQQININLKELDEKIKEFGLAGMEHAVRTVVRDVLIGRTKFMTEGIKKVLKPSRGIMLYGPPGTGKTTFARNLAKVLGCTGDRLIMKTATEVFNKYVGQSEENVRKLFEPSKAAFAKHGDKSPLYIIVLDEIDAILSERGSGGSSGSWKDTVVNQFLGELDGLDQVNNLIVIGMTNRLDTIDPAAIRPGRFGCKIEIELPTSQQRQDIFKMYVNRLKDEKIFSEVFMNALDGQLPSFATKTSGFSGADIEYVMIKACNLVVEAHLMETTKSIEQDDVDSIIYHMQLAKNAQLEKKRKANFEQIINIARQMNNQPSEDQSQVHIDE
jgi:ATP-dependent 26S proteasome regulatory subunit